MNDKMKVTGLLVGGYLLGRTKKLKLALTVAASVSGSALYRNRDQIQEAFGKLSESSPDLKNLQGKVTGRLADQVGAKIQAQTDKINASLDDAGAEEEAPQEDDADAADDPPEKEPDQAAEEKPKASSRSGTKSSGSKSAGGSGKTAAKGSSSSASKTQGAKK